MAELEEVVTPTSDVPAGTCSVVNALLHRGRVYRPELLGVVLRGAAEHAAHVVVTGDVTDLALETPLGRAEALSQFEERFGDPGQLERSLIARFTRIGAGDVAYQARAILSAPRVSVRVVRNPKGGPNK